MKKRRLASSHTTAFSAHRSTTPTFSTYKCGACAAFWTFYRYCPEILTGRMIREHYEHLRAAHRIPTFTAKGWRLARFQFLTKKVQDGTASSNEEIEFKTLRRKFYPEKTRNRRRVEGSPSGASRRLRTIER